MIKLISNDDTVFEVEEKVARLSRTIADMLDNLGENICKDGKPIPLLNVDGLTMQLIVDWAKHHKDDAALPEEDPEILRLTPIDSWDKQFLSPLDMDTLADVMMAAGYLQIEGLYDSTAKVFASFIEGKTFEEIRTKFGLPDDNTPEFVAKYREQYEWADLGN